MRIARLGHVGQDPADADDDDRHVDQEHRAPPEVLEQEPAEQRAEGDSAADGSRPDADGPAALGRREDHGDDRQGHREHRGPADAHQRAGCDELLRGPGERAEDGGQGEQHQAEDQDAPAAVAIAEDSPREQQGREHQRVGVDRPDQLALGGPQVLLDRLQGDVEDRVVQHHHQQADDQRRQRPPPVRGALGGGWAQVGGRGAAGRIGGHGQENTTPRLPIPRQGYPLCGARTRDVPPFMSSGDSERSLEIRSDPHEHARRHRRSRALPRSPVHDRIGRPRCTGRRGRPHALRSLPDRPSDHHPRSHRRQGARREVADDHRLRRAHRAHLRRGRHPRDARRRLSGDGRLRLRLDRPGDRGRPAAPGRGRGPRLVARAGRRRPARSARTSPRPSRRWRPPPGS